MPMFEDAPIVVHEKYAEKHKSATCNEGCCKDGCGGTVCINYVGCGDHHCGKSECNLPCKHCLVWSGYGGIVDNLT